MGILHELLAVHSEVQKTSRAILAEAITTFTKKDEHFDSINKTYTPNDEDGDKLPEENKEMVTTVRDKLDYVVDTLVRELDISFQLGVANTQARADVYINGQVVAANVPSSVLLEFENKFKEIREMYRNLPTYDPGERWSFDSGRKNVYVAEPKRTVRTNKKVVPIVLYPATDKHPAQVQTTTEEKPAGIWTTIRRTGKISPREKADLLARIDSVYEALKTARMRANQAEHPTGGFAKKLFSFVHTGVADPS